MGLADLIPGISGGTIAFILGFYQRLIQSLATFSPSQLVFFLRKRHFSKELSESFLFLFSLFSGMGLSLLFFSYWVLSLFQDPLYRVYLYSFFFGVVLGSIRHRKKRVLLWNKKRFFFFTLGFFFSFSITFLQGKNFLSWESGRFSFFLVLAGALTIFAMLLPGISGSYILLLLGLYVPSLKALSSLWSLRIDSFLFLIQLGIGAFLGFFFFAHMFSYLNKRYRENLEANLLGFLLGSLGFIWPYGSYIHSLHGSEGIILNNHQLVFSVLFLLAGYFLLQRTHKKAEKTLPLIE